MKTSRHFRQFASLVSLLVFAPHSSGETSASDPATGKAPAAVGKALPRPTSPRDAVAPEPGAAHAELKSAKSRYFFGEPFRVELVLTNVGQKPFSVATGGDYRGSNRELRYRVQAVDEKGAVVPEADFPVFFGGGMMGAPHVVTPGKTWSHELWPLDYLHLTAPGKYKLRITHDFGWNPEFPDATGRSDKAAEAFSSKIWRSPIGEMSVEFVRPDEKQAEAVLAAIAEAIKTKAEDRIPQSRDLSDPVYLAPLRRRAERGETHFLSSIGEIPTHEATLALIEMAETSEPPVAQNAAEILVYRIPRVARLNNGRIGRINDESWDASFVPRVRGIARHLLEKSSESSDSKSSRAPSAVETGARILSSIGEAEDYECLCASLEKVLNRSSMDRRHRETGTTPPEAQAFALLEALDRLQKKHPHDYSNFSGKAGILLMFRYASTDTEARRKRLIEHVNIFGNDCNYMIPVAALRSLPKPLPQECRKFVADSLEHRDFGIVAAACDALADSDNRSWVPDLLLVIRAENEETVLRAATRAAQKLGARRDLADALADRLIDADMSPVALDLLREMVVKDNGSRGGRSGFSRKTYAAFQSTWKKWIQEHADDLERGVRFVPGDDDHLPQALFKQAVEWNVQGRGLWPERAPEGGAR